MQYALMFHETPEQFTDREGPEVGAYWGAWRACMDALESEVGILAGRALHAPALDTAARRRTVGRYQVEAALQSAHVARRRGGATWDDIARLYDVLVALSPSVGARVGRAAAIGQARGPVAGLSALDAISPVPAGYQPWWAVRAHLLAAAGRASEARAARQRAIGLSADPAVRAWLAQQGPTDASLSSQSSRLDTKPSG